MKRTTCVVLLMFAAILLTSCGARLKSGEVYDKKFSEAHEEIKMIPVVRTDGENCYTTIIPMVYFYADDYIVFIKANDGTGKTAIYHVSKEVYELIEIGSEFEYDPKTCSTESKYTREYKK